VRKRHGPGFAAVAAAVLAAMPGMTTVSGAATWTVRPGGPVSMKSGRFTLTDTTTGSALSCQSSALSGTLKGGSGLPGSGIGSITTVGFTHCSTPLGPGFTLQARDLPWQLNFSSYNAATGVAAGSLSHVRIKLLVPDCDAVIDGTSGSASDGIVNVRYINSTGVFQARTTGGNLHFYNVRGCAGLIRTGDSATISARFAVSPKQVITSP
jgi:hypothetical protein